MYVHHALAEESVLNPSYWNTPARKALLIGGAAAAVGGLAFLLTRDAKAKQGRPDLAGSGICTQWNYIENPTYTLGDVGRYRVEIMLPGAPRGTYEDFLAEMDGIGKALPGLKIEGAWLGVVAYPRNKQMPLDWPLKLDNYGEGTRLRVQYVSAYPNLGDVLARLIAESFADATLLPVLHAWKCMTSPAPAVQKLPVRGVTVEDADGGITFQPFGHYVLSMRALPQVDIKNMAAQLASQGFVVTKSLAADDAWGFELYYRNTQPMKWARASLPGGLIVQRLLIDTAKL